MKFLVEFDGSKVDRLSLFEIKGVMTAIEGFGLNVSRVDGREDDREEEKFDLARCKGGGCTEEGKGSFAFDKKGEDFKHAFKWIEFS